MHIRILRRNDGEPDWAHLLPDLVRKIAEEKLLAVDVTEYIKLRAVCKPWRESTVDPSVLHPRFFPRNWLMLRPRATSDDEDDGPKVNADTYSFVNVRTSDTLRIRLPRVEQYGHFLVTGSAEGFLLFTCHRTNTVCLFNPLTTATYILPGLDKAWIPMEDGLIFFTAAGIVFDTDCPDLPTVVLIVTNHSSTVILYTKPGDDHWGIVDTGVIDDVPRQSVLIDNIGNMLVAQVPPFDGGLSLNGQFYIATRQGGVLKVELAPHPHLVYMLRPDGPPYSTTVSCHLVPSLDHDDFADNDGMLLVRSGHGTKADVYGVHLSNKSCTLLLELGNRTIILPSHTLQADSFFPLLHPGMVHSIYEKVEDYVLV